MDPTTENSARERALDFLKIWHHVFAKNLEYVVEGLQPDLTLNAQTIGDDGICQMGQWLKVQEDDIRRLPDYEQLLVLHRDFHLAAAQLVRLHQTAPAGAARAYLHGAFAAATQAVSEAIDRLSDELARRGIYPARFPNAQPQFKSIWSDSLRIGIPEVDRHHHAIATLIDQVLVNGDIDCVSTEGLRFLNVLSRMILSDIEAENRLLKALAPDVQDYAAHLDAHEAITAYLTHIAESVCQGHAVSFAQVGNDLANWYIEHLVSHDLDLEQVRHHLKPAMAA